ncbi:MAG TPA: carboxypeptidase-like regulatory domain-containing protein, partial [Balneolaceae bacterium]|nr:carboxypeptidase-like regulatory domain-containing protein [Balneolaceae bacterium]
MREKLAYIICCVLLTGIWVTPVHAQDQNNKQYSFDFRGEPLSGVLEEIATKTGIDMVYDPKIVAGVTVYSRINNEKIHRLLKDILAETELDFLTLSSGTIVIVKKVSEEAAYGSFAGKVVDQKTGEPLPGATIMLADASGGTSAGPSGSFTLNHLMSGSYKIIFSYVGYQAVTKTIRIRPNQHNRQKVALNPKPVDFTPIVVTDHLPQLPGQEGSGHSVNPDSPWEPIGRMQDAIRSLSLFSGVQYGLPMTDLHLQGGQR